MAMFDPHAHIFDAVLKAIFAATLVAMAGGFPCCCSEEGGSTTSTSTSSQPPIPPGSTSTSTGYVVPRFNCVWCVDNATVASQYVVTVTGFVDDFCDCDPVNGAYFIDGMIESFSSLLFSTAGCGGGVYNQPFTCFLDEITEDPYIYLIQVELIVAGGTGGGGPTEQSMTWVGVHLDDALGAFSDGGYEFRTTHSASIPDATGTVPCDTVSGTVLPLVNVFPLFPPCDESGATATPTEFTGF